MQAPFFGSKLLEGIDLNELFGMINKDVLFASRWELKGDLSRDEWKKRVEEIAIPAFDRIVELALSGNLIQPRVVYGHFSCAKSGNHLFVKHENMSMKFDFPRERQSPNRCIADFFPYGFVTIQIVTIGNEASGAAARLFKEDKYLDSFYLKGFAAEAADALAGYSQGRIAEELGIAKEKGVRFSFGYPTCPNLMDQEKLARLLNSRQIGVVLSRTMHLLPEYSTSAIISFDDKAARFIP